MVSVQPSHAPGMLALGLAANRFSNCLARRSRLGSPRSSASNSSSTHTPDSLFIGLQKVYSKREFTAVYNPCFTTNHRFLLMLGSQQARLLYKRMPYNQISDL